VVVWEPVGWVRAALVAVAWEVAVWVVEEPEICCLKEDP
jgi:hypothetical protein